MGNLGELRVLADEAGLDEAEVAEVIESDTYRERVLDMTAQAQSISITGVPAFLLDRQLLSGLSRDRSLSKPSGSYETRNGKRLNLRENQVGQSAWHG